MYDIGKQICYCIRKYMGQFITESCDWPKDIEGWRELYLLADNQNITGVVYEGIRNLPEFLQLPAEYRDIWKNETLKSVKRQLRNDNSFINIYKKILGAGVIPIVVKGAACRYLYKDAEHRVSADEDILVRRYEYEKVHKVLIEAGFACNLNEDEKIIIYKLQEITYLNKNNGLVIELHLDLFSVESEIYGNYNKWFEKVFENKEFIIFNGVKLYTMSPTEHFLYLCCHAFKHFVHSGFGIRQIMDIIMTGKFYTLKIDWEYIWTKLEEMKTDILFMNFFYIGEKYLGIPMKIMGGNDIIFSNGRTSSQLDGEDLLMELFDAGIYGKSSINRQQSSQMTLSAVEKQNADTSINKMNALFPKRIALVGRYKFLEDYHFLLPLAWLLRILNYTSSKYKSGNAFKDADKSINYGKNRIEMFEKYKIIR